MSAQTLNQDGPPTNTTTDDGAKQSSRGGAPKTAANDEATGSSDEVNGDNRPTITDTNIANNGSGGGGSNGTNENDSSNNKVPTSNTKPNGLKNRIIQRPPPLVLDKVSNFYDADTNDCIAQPYLQRQNVASNSVGASSNNNTKRTDGKQNQASQHNAAKISQINPVTQSSRVSHTDEAFINDRTPANHNNNNNNSNNNAKQKFWASLNENASRNKALANARSVSTTSTTTATSLNETNPPHSKRATTIETDSVNSLEPDLIIKHRNSSGAISSSRMVSTLSAHKQQNQDHQHHHHHQQQHYRNSHHEPHINHPDGRSNVTFEPIGSTHTIKDEQQTADHEHLHNSIITEDNQKDALNNSDDLEDCGIVDESNGGNLVGVDTTTPPATDLARRDLQSDEPPASATGSRPRSTNPFLNENDDDFEEYRNSIRSESANRDSFSLKHQNNFHKRPASFIAATDRLAGTIRPAYDFAKKQQIIEEKLNELHLNEQNLRDNKGYPNRPPEAFMAQQVIPPHKDQLDSNSQYQSTHYSEAPQQIATHDQPANHKTHTPYDPCIELYREPTISVDSESTVCQPPPSATMQLPHWTEAIYELNNAILESSSLAGGSDNGQFIYIIGSGDIILELDHIKVSGFTLVEFNKLVESKQFHLLKAVQTKHSHGLTLDLREYLNLSFPKNSKDKQLQNIIRENIYRRTIPCTTRPPRLGEVDNIDYHFLTKEQFTELNKRGMLLECGVYVGHFYGTLKPSCDLNQLPECSKAIQDETSDRLRQAWDNNHPAVEMIMKKDASNNQAPVIDQPVYENHESLRIQQQQHQHFNNIDNALQSANLNPHVRSTNIVAVDSEALPPGWERVMDQTHGIYYIDHNTQKTQFERPYEVELTKGSMGFGFTLVEADSGLLLVRSIIHGGPAHMNGLIRPGDILISAVGVSVTGLQHTDIARLFSTFAVGDRVRLTFARSNYILDDNLVPDEYLFSNGTNGDLAIAVNPNNYQLNQNLPLAQNPQIISVNQEFEFIQVTLKRGDQGFGFTIGDPQSSDSTAGQRVRKIQNHDICSNLKQGDILVDLNGEDITKMSHTDVVERLKRCPPGENVTLTVKRKKRFRSKTPMAMHTDATGEYSLDSTPQRNCKTPSLDGLMLKRPGNYNSKELSNVSRALFRNSNQAQLVQETTPRVDGASYDANLMNGLPPPQINSFEQQLYGSLPMPRQQPQHQGNNSVDLHLNHNIHEQHSLPIIPSLQNNHNYNSAPVHMESDSLRSSQSQYGENIAKPNFSGTSGVPQPRYHTNLQMNDFNQLNQYNNFMNNDKLVMMQMQQPKYQPQIYTSSDYHQVPLYSNSEILKSELIPQQHELNPALPIKPPVNPYLHNLPPDDNFQNNFYANNEEIALQSMQYNYLPQASQMPVPTDQFTFVRPISHGTPHDEHDEYEYHNVDLERENTDSNWGIRLIGGAEVDRAISIGSMIFGGVASKSGKLKSGDEIISIDGVNVVGATHQHVVELISACSNRVSLVVRRKTFAEACDVVLTKNTDEGFGFVIISNENCALIGKIIEGSPADRCRQLRVRDCIIAVNGRYITPDMKHPEIVNMIKECGSTLRLRIIPVDCYTVKLIKDIQNDSFGFRMRGGSEYDGTPLYIVRVEPNGQAHGLLNVGDQILEINNIPTVGMTHQQAATIIKYSDPIVKLKLRRNYVTPPSLLVDSPRSLQKYNQTAEMKQVNLASTPNNQPSSHDASFASLPSNFNLMNQHHQHQQHQQMQIPMSVPMTDHILQPAHHQPICDQHSMVYVD
uniref:Membrane-associated guanylate kinase, WW and PDZ domain-containing protein 3 n=1 Tax=Aceria tosichella TaxID=561515 RepID=A0A6G1SQU6_9ACAR